MNEKGTAFLRDLYPELTESELTEAEENLDRYLAFVMRIFERTESEADPQAVALAPAAGTIGSNSPQASA